MSSRISAGLTAAIVTLLSVSCLGVLAGGLDYFVIKWLEHALEVVGLLPVGWGRSHFSALVAATVVTALPPLVYFGVVLYRHSYEVERGLADREPASDPPE